MTTRMTLLSNPRLLAYALMMLLLLAAGIALFPLMGPFYGIAATAIAAFVDWTMFKILRRQLRTTVTVDEDGARFNLYGESTYDFPWADLTLVGMAVEARGRGSHARKLFFYKKAGDHSMVLTAEYARFDDLVAEVRRFVPSFHDITLDAGETLKHRLLRLLLVHVATDDSGIRFILVDDETLSFPWNAIRLAGLAKEPVKRGQWARRLFVCQDLDDRWMLVPEQFERFEELVATVRERTTDVFRDITLDAGENLKDRLRPLLGEPPTAVTTSPSTEPDPGEPADRASSN